LGCGLVLVNVGNFDPAILSRPSVPFTETNSVTDLDKIGDNMALTDWLIPSVCLKTFSFTTHESAGNWPGTTHAVRYTGLREKPFAKAENGICHPFFCRECILG